jgi:hypothetical protein
LGGCFRAGILFPVERFPHRIQCELTRTLLAPLSDIGRDKVLLRNSSSSRKPVFRTLGRSGGKADAALSHISRNQAALLRRKTLEMLLCSLCGAHAEASADVVDILQDLSNIWTFAPQILGFVAVGDWNLTASISVMRLSPPTEADKFSRPSGAIQIGNWIAANAFLQSRQWTLRRPTTMVQAQQLNVLYDAGAIFAHVPRGAQADHAAPSLIDWCIHSRGLNLSVWCSWNDTPADHAFVVVDVEILKLKLPKRLQTTLTCADPRRVITSLAARRLKLDTLAEAVAGLRSPCDYSC